MNDRFTIFVVDDRKVIRNRIRRTLIEQHDVQLFTSGSELIAMLDSSIRPDLILLDTDMPNMDGFKTLEHLRSDSRTKDCPIILLAAPKHGDHATVTSGLLKGATDVFVKPLPMPLLLARVNTQLKVLEQRESLRCMNHELKYAMLFSFAEMIERRDKATGAHVLRTQKYISTMLNQMKATGTYADAVSTWDDDRFLTQCARLHDVGKIAIPDSILLKPSQLSNAEYEQMKEHTLIGANILDAITTNVSDHAFVEKAKHFALSHHERWDGSGYPHGLSGLDIPLEGRIMAIADSYDAIMTIRTYNKRRTHEWACGDIISKSGTWYDPALIEVFKTVTDAFLAILMEYPGDTWLEPPPPDPHSPVAVFRR